MGQYIVGLINKGSAMAEMATHGAQDKFSLSSGVDLPLFNALFLSNL